MQTHLAAAYQGTEAGQEAEAILRKCVHCGFCTATCPTYQTLGDELDGPRGRIYLIKQVLEGATPTRATQQHLDRCLTCRNCETTCPSGVQYGHLVDIGRHVVDAQVGRPWKERGMRWLLKTVLPSKAFAPALRVGQALRPWLPAKLQAKVPPRSAATSWPRQVHARKVLLLAGCVQPALQPNINAATARVLDAVGLQTVVVPQAGCCGAVAFHLNDQEAGRQQARANIDAWWPWVERGEIEAVVSNASGCGAMVKDWGHLLRHDPLYAAKAQRVSALARDVSELLPPALPLLQQRLAGWQPLPHQRWAYHPPCTLQHGQRLRGGVESLLEQLGFPVSVARTESHLCCGSAGTYSLLQPQIANSLRDRKLQSLADSVATPTAILSANIGCIGHLQTGTEVPVRHWIEALDEALAASSQRG